MEKLNCKCPICDSDLLLAEYGCICSYYDREGSCNFLIGTIAGVTLDKTELETLITTGNLPIRDGFLSRTKKPFKAGLNLIIEQDTTGDYKYKKINFKFPPKGETV